jgi:hypothetical protein
LKDWAKVLVALILSVSFVLGMWIYASHQRYYFDGNFKHDRLTGESWRREYNPHGGGLIWVKFKE